MEDLQDGKTVYAPSKKRNRSPAPEKFNKKSKKSSSKSRQDDSDDDGFIDDGDEEVASDAGSDAGSNSDKREPLTESEIEEKITQSKSDKKHARRERSEIDVKIKTPKGELSSLKKEYGEFETKMSAVCIAGRNDYSKTAIQSGFAADIKVLGQMNAQEEDEEAFNPDDDARDYEEVTRSPPVLCVSS